ncbi:MAG TPA: FecR family protein [Cyclobacteriaceae bacterium]|nr:FecR family protein [Cyclobacteriaceae bacterium]
MTKSNLEELMDRYLTGDVTPEEKKKIELWFEVRKTNGEVHDALKEEDSDRIFQALTNRISVEEAEKIFRKKLIVSPSRIIGIAAAMLVLTFTFLLWSRYERNSAITKQVLNDGTLVWLKGKSSLAYFEKEGSNIRSAGLVGEALFEVAKDASRPFVLSVGDYKIKVLGTSFNVKPIENGIELDVLTGKVNISSESDSVGLLVSANEKVLYSGRREMVHSTLTSDDAIALITRTEYDMSFEDSSLEEVFEKIEKKFGVTIAVENKRILNCSIHADFTDHSLQSTLMLLAEAVDIQYVIKDKVVTISGDGCE